MRPTIRFASPNAEFGNPNSHFGTLAFCSASTETHLHRPAKTLFGFNRKSCSASPKYAQGAVAIPSLATLAGSDVPRYVPTAIVDRIMGISAANAVTTGLYCRERTGEGLAIDVPMFETMAQLNLADRMGGQTFAPPMGPAGYDRLLSHGDMRSDLL
ncbi:hypothetical protein KBK24_0119820 [Burkholderia sp. K24]|nr:hypothetical protein KBK24_0119820 [Burkholderia sp. K24]